MDAPLAAAARALAAGDPLDALHHVALRGDPPALALRGIALAQLGDLERARALLRRAARAFRPEQELARARCELAETDVALAMRDLDWPTKRWNPPARPCCGTATSPTPRMPGCCMRGACCCWAVPTTPPSPSRAGIRRRCPPRAGGACRRRRHRAAPPAGRTRPAGAGPGRAAARRSGIGALQAEADALSRLLEAPAARLTHHGAQRLLRLDEVEALMASDALVADTARQALRSPMATVDLSRRPVLFALARQLAEAWPGDAPRRR